MRRVAILGAGNIGAMITFLLTRSNDYHIYLADIHSHNPLDKWHLENFSYFELDATDKKAVMQFFKKNDIEAVVSCLPYFCNRLIAEAAAELSLHYFDLTEDVETTHHIQKLAKTAKTAFVPQCGLAPGFISIIANHLMQHFAQLDTVKLRVGALPSTISNALQYSLTWSTDGLINEYGNPCEAILESKKVVLQPLEGLEEIKVDGLTYEAFNTSGGIGSLVESCGNKVRNLSYKTIRYPGHCAKIKFLMNDLKLNHERETLKHILEHALPKTIQDVVIVYVSVTGKQQDQFMEENYIKKFYPQLIGEKRWSAIQLTTASGLCSVLDMVLDAPTKFHGFIKQEEFSYEALINNRFGKYFI